MKRSPALAALLVVALAVSASVGFAGVTGAQSADVQISDVGVTPSNPAPGESFTLTANVSNLASSNGTVTVRDVYVRTEGTANEHARVENSGSVAVGQTLSVPLSASFSQPGTKNLRVHAIVETPDGGSTHLEYPVRVTVEKHDDVLLSVPTSQAVVDEPRDVNVTVANGDDRPIDSVKLTLTGDGSVENEERITASIDAGTDRTFDYDVTFEESGSKTLNATLTYTTDAGVTRSISETATVEVTNGSAATGGIEGDIQLTGVEARGSGVVTIQGDAANVGGTDVESVLLSVEETDAVSPMGASGEYFVGAVNASQFDTFELIATVDGEASAIPVRLSYIVGGERKIEHTEVDVSSDGGGGGPMGALDRDRDRDGRSMDERHTPPGQRRSSSGLLSVGSLLVPLVAVIALSAGGYYVWKRR